MSAIQLVHGNVKTAALRAVLSDATEIVVVSAYTTRNGLAAIEQHLLGPRRAIPVRVASPGGTFEKGEPVAGSIRELVRLPA